MNSIAPAATPNSSRLGPAWPIEKAPISRAKNTCREASGVVEVVGGGGGWKLWVEVGGGGGEYNTSTVEELLL